MGDDRVTDPNIRDLRAEAGNAWDPETVRDCEAALEGDLAARERVEAIIRDARARARDDG